MGPMKQNKSDFEDMRATRGDNISMKRAPMLLECVFLAFFTRFHTSTQQNK